MKYFRATSGVFRALSTQRYLLNFANVSYPEFHDRLSRVESPMHSRDHRSLYSNIHLRRIILIQFSPRTIPTRIYIFHFLIPPYDLHKVPLRACMHEGFLGVV